MAAGSHNKALARQPVVERVEASRKRGSAGYIHEDDPTLRGWTPRVKAYRDPSKRASTIAKLRGLAWMLDTALPLPLPWSKDFRIGLDALIGIIPGIGDVMGAILSGLILREAWRMGAPLPTMAKMTGNVLLELFVGAIPFLGDAFDAAYKANVRNLRIMGIWKD